MIQRYKNDAAKRKRLFVAEAFAHPAKGHISLWEEMVLRYSKEGDTILDPMAGIGTTLVAALMGRNVICVELEPHFVEPMRRSWEKMRNIPMLGYQVGTATIIQGNARALPLPDASQFIDGPPELMSEVKNNEGRWSSRTYRFSKVHLQGALGANNDDAAHPGDAASEAVDTVITSPPWEDKTALQNSEWLHSHEAELAEQYRQRNPGKPGNPGNTKAENRSTMGGYTREDKMSDGIVCICGHYKAHHYSNKGYLTRCLWTWHGKTCDCSEFHEDDHGGLKSLIDAIVTSPPYEAAFPEVRDGTSRGLATRLMMEERGHQPSQYGQRGYTRPVDAIVSSPPYSGGGHHEGAFDTWGGVQRASEHLADSYTPDKHDRMNIGNMKGDPYWSAMRQVYAECWRVLKPGGILALVLKGFTRDGQYVDLPGQTEALLLEAGWQKHDEWRRELWSLSFWRILQRRRDPQAFDERLKFEEVLAFRKPGG